jgi:hypothetical protein
VKLDAKLATVGAGAVVIVATILSAFLMPTMAISAISPSPIPLTVVIPEKSSPPTPTPSSTGNDDRGSDGGNNGTGSGGGSGHGGSGGAGSGSGSGDGTRLTDPDGSPTAPRAPMEHADGLDLDRERVSTKQWMIATGSGFTPGEKVKFVLYSDPIVVGSFVANASGQATARFLVPDSLRSGVHVTEATGWDSRHVENKRFTVLSGAAVASIPALWWLIVVFSVLLIGLISTSIHFRRTIAGWFGVTTGPTGSAL